MTRIESGCRSLWRVDHAARFNSPQYRPIHRREQVHNNVGSGQQAGTEYEVDRKVALFVDYKELWLGVNPHGFLAGGGSGNRSSEIESLHCFGWY